jgi:solute carrier family 32 (vesicular inhibitory amino acid transporter)
MPSALQHLVQEWRVVANVFNIFVGAGVLALPFAVASSGWLGLVLLLSVSCMANFTVRGLSEVAMHTGFDGYGQMANATFGSRGRKLVNLLLLVDIGSLLCVLLLLIGENLFLIMPAMATQASWTVLAGLGVLPTMFIDLSGISWLSLFGDCCQLLLFGAMVSNAGCGTASDGAAAGSDACATVVAERGITLSAGLYIYAWAGHPVVPSIVGGSREEQERFGGVANAACALIFGWLALFGGVGYALFGRAVPSNVLQAFDPAGATRSVAAAALALNMFFTFALVRFPVEGILRGLLLGPARQRHGRAQVAGLRLGIVGVATAVAASVRNFAAIAAPVGALLVTLNSFVLPLLFHAVLLPDGAEQSLGSLRQRMAVLGAAVALGVAAMGALVYMAGVCDDPCVEAPPLSFVLLVTAISCAVGAAAGSACAKWVSARRSAKGMPPPSGGALLKTPSFVDARMTSMRVAGHSKLFEPRTPSGTFEGGLERADSSDGALSFGDVDMRQFRASTSQVVLGQHDMAEPSTNYVAI